MHVIEISGATIKNETEAARELTGYGIIIEMIVVIEMTEMTELVEVVVAMIETETGMTTEDDSNRLKTFPEQYVLRMEKAF